MGGHKKKHSKDEDDSEGSGSEHSGGSGSEKGHGKKKGGHGKKKGHGKKQDEGGHSSFTSYATAGAAGGLSRDFSEAEEHATRAAGDSADRSLFSSALSALQGSKDELPSQTVDEGHAIDSYKAFFGGSSSTSSADSGSMGAAAAMQALKMFNSSGSSGGTSGSSGSSGGAGLLASVLGHGSSSSSGGGAQNAFVGMAMAEASKLYDQQNASGNVSSGTDKQSVINEAAKKAALFYLKSEMTGGTSGGGSGGASGLMSLASKFM